MGNEGEFFEVIKKGTDDSKAVKAHMREIVKIWRRAPCSSEQKLVVFKLSVSYMEQLFALNDDDFQDEIEES